MFQHRKILFSLATLVLLFGIFIFGPPLIHAAYRATTPGAVIESQRVEYSRLANSELQLSGTAKAASQKRRYKLYMWFHARGFSIDEGDDEYPMVLRCWSDLIAYWRGDDGSRFYPSSKQ